MTATLFLVRHAAHDNVGGFLAGRKPGVHLGKDGLAQAERLGQRMARERFETVIASPRERTQETAAAIAKAQGGMAVQTEAALDEVDFGAWSGSTWDVLNKLPEWRHWNDQRSMAATPNGETMLDVQRRVMSVIRPLVLAEKDSRTVLVTHADVVKSVLSVVLGLPVDGWTKLEISPASISTIVLGTWGGKVLSINETIA